MESLLEHLTQQQNGNRWHCLKSESTRIDNVIADIHTVSSSCTYDNPEKACLYASILQYLIKLIQTKPVVPQYKQRQLTQAVDAVNHMLLENRVPLKICC